MRREQGRVVFGFLGARRKRLRAWPEACRSMMRSGEYVLSLAWTTRARRTRLWPGAHRAHASTHVETPTKCSLSLRTRRSFSPHPQFRAISHTRRHTRTSTPRTRQAPRLPAGSSRATARCCVDVALPPPRASCSPRTRGRRVWAPAPGCAPRACRRLYCAASAAAAAMASSAWRRAAASATRPLELSASVPGPEEAAPPSGLPSESA